MRMSGSHEAKRAWLFLRGPYLAAYMGYFVLTQTSTIGNPENFGELWKWAASLMAVMLILGSTSSWMVVSQREPQSLWRMAESLEVTALRLATIFQLAFGILALYVEKIPASVAAGHLIIGLMFLGVLTNMSWPKVKPRQV